MKKQTVFKKLLSSIIVAIIVLGNFSSYRLISDAALITTEGDGPLYLSLSPTNEHDNGYAIAVDQGEIIWNIVSHSNEEGSNSTFASNLYCIKAHDGGTWSGGDSIGTPSSVIKYNKRYNVPLGEELIKINGDAIALQGKYKNELLWLIDHLFVEGESDLIQFLAQADIFPDPDEGEGYYYFKSYNHEDYGGNYNSDAYQETATEEDILAIQQAAIWYFTNYGLNSQHFNQIHHGAEWLEIATKQQLEQTPNKYTLLSNYPNPKEHEGRAMHCNAIYNYLIDEATKVAAEYNKRGETYQLKNSTATLWLSADENGNIKQEQPVIEVHKTPKQFDLALRKAIVSVENGTVINETGEDAKRNIEIDETTLNNGDGDTKTDTATYKHRKDPVLVEKDDIVTYSITIYNEGEQDGYASEIIDQLPLGLRLLDNQPQTVTSTLKNEYKVEYMASEHKIKITNQETPKTIPAYNGVTLSSDSIQIKCKVETEPEDLDSTEKITLTNIAYISKEYNSETGQTIEKQPDLDRDSEPGTAPTKTYTDLRTTGNDKGYIGNSENQSLRLSDPNAYFKGEQDDDDFEKLVILPKDTYNLQIIKVDSKDEGKKLAGAKFTITVNGEDPQTLTTDSDGLITLNGLKLSTKGTQTIVIDEIQAPNGYNKILTEAITIEVTVDLVDGKYTVTSAVQKNSTSTGEKVTLINGTIKTIKVTIPNEKITGSYNIKVVKEDLKGNKLAGAKFKIEQIDVANGNVLKTYDNLTTTDDGIVETGNIEIPAEGTYRYKITELQAPNHYINKGVPTIIDVTATIVGGAYQVTYKEVSGEEKAIVKEGNTIQITIDNTPIFDLSLRKYIREVDGIPVENSRVPRIDTTKLQEVTDTTAEYKHRKDAVLVENGSVVTYNISIYNEGYMDGIASVIKDQLPTGLVLDLISLQSETVQGKLQYYVTTSKGNKYIVTYDESTNLVTFTLDTNTTAKNLKAYDDGNTLDSDTIAIKCIVNQVADTQKNIYLTNIAYIYEAKDEQGTIIKDQKGKDRDSEPYTHPGETADDLKKVGDDKEEQEGYIGNTDNEDLEQKDPDSYFKGEQDDDDFEKLVIVPKTFDLKLIKFIAAVNGESTGNRVLSVDTSNLGNGENGTETTAKYILEKKPVGVKAGDFVTYTIRVYNEGDYDGYATEISEDIPQGLEFIVVTDGNILYSWDGKTQTDITDQIKDSDMYEEIIRVNSNWGSDFKSTIITTKALSEDLIKGFGQKDVQYADSENKIDYKEIQVIFRVKDDVEPNVTIRNEAAISEDKAVQNNQEVDIDDRDSTPGNTDDTWKKEDSDKHYDKEEKWPIYEEDDEDYDNIITKSFDLSLRKQIVKINDAIYTNRFAKLDEKGEYDDTLYDYYDVYAHTPKVKAGDIVTYSIKVYNEGEIDGYASLIVDELPSGLEFYSSIYNDIDYGWTLVEGSKNLYQTDYLSYENDVKRGTIGTKDSTLLKAYTGEGEASYQEIFIVCKVKDDVTKNDSLLNVAQIADDSDENGKPIKDKDSEPGNKDDEKQWKDEDDLDIENLELQEFDLALRKFITKVENGENVKDVTTRIPQVSYDKDKQQLVYTHPKDALVVHVGDTVIYTIRVYNEGDIDGYAAEVKDDLPEYLEYLPEHNTNKKYEWVMYDKDGNVTENVADAVCIRTTYLAKGNGAEKEQENANLLKAFDPNAEISDNNPDYRDIEVAFKVKDPNSSEYEIVNFAEISEDTDKDGEPIKDKDSDTDNGDGEPKEDDEDIEKVKVEYFDLSLLKYVTKVLVNENGVERTMETGNTGNDETDIIPHVQINKKNIDKTVVKFVYTIKITNEGQIAGEATEITDYVPAGLRFVAEDNELWTDEGNNIISTRQLEGTILQPGESAEVEVVLRWINGDDNLGPKTNVAEISEDHNDEDVPDKDSTPDNEEPGEDDIDDATVLLSVNQGGGIQSIYTNLIVTFLVIILVGGILIKRFVL